MEAYALSHDMMPAIHARKIALSHQPTTLSFIDRKETFFDPLHARHNATERIVTRITHNVGYLCLVASPSLNTPPQVDIFACRNATINAWPLCKLIDIQTFSCLINGKRIQGVRAPGNAGDKPKPDKKKPEPKPDKKKPEPKPGRRGDRAPQEPRVPKGSYASSPAW